MIKKYEEFVGEADIEVAKPKFLKDQKLILDKKNCKKNFKKNENMINIMPYEQFIEQQLFIDTISEQVELMINDDKPIDEIERYLLENFNIILDTDAFIEEINETSSVAAEHPVPTGAPKSSLKNKIAAHFVRNKHRYAIGGNVLYGAAGAAMVHSGVKGLKTQHGHFNNAMNTIGVVGGASVIGNAASNIIHHAKKELKKKFPLKGNKALIVLPK